VSSTTALGIVPNRRPIDLAEWRNGHGWSPSIWARLLKANYGFEGYIFGGPDGGDRLLDKLWNSIEGLPEWQQAPLVLTFDTGVIPWQRFEWAADQMEEFERRLPATVGHANHVPAMIALLRSKPEVPLLGVYGTSVSENPFDPIEFHEDDSCAEDGKWCEGHGSGIPASEMYVLEHQRDLASEAASSGRSHE
jgi:hypothetical protein